MEAKKEQDALEPLRFFRGRHERKNGTRPQLCSQVRRSRPASLPQIFSEQHVTMEQEPPLNVSPTPQQPSAPPRRSSQAQERGRLEVGEGWPIYAWTRTTDRFTPLRYPHLSGAVPKGSSGLFPYVRFMHSPEAAAGPADPKDFLLSASNTSSYLDRSIDPLSLVGVGGARSATRPQAKSGTWYLNSVGLDALAKKWGQTDRLAELQSVPSSLASAWSQGRFHKATATDADPSAVRHQFMMRSRKRRREESTAPASGGGGGMPSLPPREAFPSTGGGGGMPPVAPREAFLLTGGGGGMPSISPREAFRSTGGGEGGGGGMEFSPDVLNPLLALIGQPGVQSSSRRRRTSRRTSSPAQPAEPPSPVQATVVGPGVVAEQGIVREWASQRELKVLGQELRELEAREKELQRIEGDLVERQEAGADVDAELDQVQAQMDRVVSRQDAAAAAIRELEQLEEQQAEFRQEWESAVDEETAKKQEEEALAEVERHRKQQEARQPWATARENLLDLERRYLKEGAPAVPDINMPLLSDVLAARQQALEARQAGGGPSGDEEEDEEDGSDGEAASPTPEHPREALWQNLLQGPAMFDGEDATVAAGDRQPE